MTKPIRYIVPFGAGPTSALSLWLAERLGEQLGHPVAVENHPGASGVRGTALVARSEPDGSTLLAANPGPLTVAPNVRHVTEYDPVRDFAPIVLIATVAGTLAVRPDLPASNVAELIALARAQPGGLTYGSPGAGTVGHLAMALFQSLAGTQLKHRPLGGLEEALPQLISGGIDVLIAPLPDVRPLAMQRKVRVLAVTRRRRSPLWPEVPTVDESGVPGFESYNWNGVSAPAGTPPETVRRINTGINAVLRSPGSSAYLLQQGYELEGGTPEAFGAFIKSEHEKWRRVVALGVI
ncbi:MAG: Bug family tripartite tricarboxylate transporter substrate binding protein [Betaproteobacteria bacterium]